MSGGERRAEGEEARGPEDERRDKWAERRRAGVGGEVRSYFYTSPSGRTPFSSSIHHHDTPAPLAPTPQNAKPTFSTFFPSIPLSPHSSILCCCCRCHCCRCRCGRCCCCSSHWPLSRAATQPSALQPTLPL